MGQTHTIGRTATSVKYDSRNGGHTTVRYHQTDVVTFTSEKITLDSGGWRTATTKNRMNQTSVQFSLGFHVQQIEGEWYVTLNDGHKEVPFEDGMVFETRTAPANYRIVRFYYDDRPSRVVHGGGYLTLVEAQAHCSRDDTHEEGVYFDGYSDSR